MANETTTQEFKGSRWPWRLELIDSGMCNGMSIGASIRPALPITGPEIALCGSSIEDARLIAAAPELLADLIEARRLLTEAMKWTIDCGRGGLLLTEEINVFYGASWASIAKALGEQS